MAFKTVNSINEMIKKAIKDPFIYRFIDFRVHFQYETINASIIPEIDPKFN